MHYGRLKDMTSSIIHKSIIAFKLKHPFTIVCLCILMCGSLYAKPELQIVDFVNGDKKIFVAIQREIPQAAKDYYNGFDLKPRIEIYMADKNIEVADLGKGLFSAFWVPRSASVIAITFTDIYSIDPTDQPKIQNIVHEEMFRLPYAVSKDREYVAVTIFRPGRRSYQILVLNTITGKKRYLNIPSSPTGIFIENKTLWIADEGDIFQYDCDGQQQDIQPISQKLAGGKFAGICNGLPVIFNAKNIQMGQAIFDLDTMQIQPISGLSLNHSFLILGKTSSNTLRMIALHQDQSIKIIEDNIAVPDTNRSFKQTIDGIWLTLDAKKLLWIDNDGNTRRINWPF